jgi:hypothetical protein
LTTACSGAKTHAMQGIFRFARQVAFIALVVRALLPAGWMPDAQAGIIICSVQTQQHDKKAPADAARHEICSFAAQPQLASVPDAPHLTAPSLHAFAARTDRAYAVTVAAHFNPASPRAPPLNA